MTGAALAHLKPPVCPRTPKQRCAGKPAQAAPAAAGGVLNSSPNADTLACLALSQAALPLARRLTERLGEEPWPLPRTASTGTPADSLQVRRVRLFAPARFCPPQAEPFNDLGALLAQIYPTFPAHGTALEPLLASGATQPLTLQKHICRICVFCHKLIRKNVVFAI